MSNKPTYDELAITVRSYEEECFALKAYVERLRRSIAGQLELEIVALHDLQTKPLSKNETFTSRRVHEEMLSNHIAYTRYILEHMPVHSLNHITEQFGCSEQALLELKARVEEETIGRCLKEMADYDVITYAEEFIRHGMKRKYSNQPETAEKDSE